MDRRELLGWMGASAAGLLAAGTSRASALDDKEHEEHEHCEHMKKIGECIRACNEASLHCLEQLKMESSDRREHHAKAHRADAGLPGVLHPGRHPYRPQEPSGPVRSRGLRRGLPLLRRGVRKGKEGAILKCGYAALVLDCCYVDICVIFSSSGSLRMRLISQFSRASGARFSETDDSPETVVGRWILPAKLKALLESLTLVSQMVPGKDFMAESKSPLFGIAPREGLSS